MVFLLQHDEQIGLIFAMTNDYSIICSLKCLADLQALEESLVEHLGEVDSCSIFDIATLLDADHVWDLVSLEDFTNTL